MAGLGIWFDTVGKGCCSGLEAMANYVVCDEASWQKLYQSANRCPEQPGFAPKIDFSKEIVLAVASGSHRPASGCVSIDEIVESSSSLDVYFTYYDCCLDIDGGHKACQPYHFVKIKKSEKPINFYKSVYPSCGC